MSTKPTLGQQNIELRAKLAETQEALDSARVAVVAICASASGVAEKIAAFVKVYRTDDLDGHTEEYMNGFDDCAIDAAAAIVSEFVAKAVEPDAEIV
jgi:hypothetical protein